MCGIPESFCPQQRCLYRESTRSASGLFLLCHRSQKAPRQKKGPGDGDQPGPNNRVFKGVPKGDAVLKITFSELLRSCSRNISATCCGVCVTHAVGLKMRLPLLFIRAFP